MSFVWFQFIKMLSLKIQLVSKIQSVSSVVIKLSKKLTTAPHLLTPSNYSIFSTTTNTVELIPPCRTFIATESQSTSANEDITPLRTLSLKSRRYASHTSISLVNFDHQNTKITKKTRVNFSLLTIGQRNSGS